MTSIDFGAVAAPCCGARYLAPQFASINLRGWRQWSDGYEAGDMWASPKTVCDCACGSLFLVSNVSSTLGGPTDQIDTEGPHASDPPCLPYLTNSRAGELVQRGTPFASPALEREVRLFHWRALNHARREWSDKRSRDWHEQGCWTDLQDTERDRLIAENARRLIPILETVYPSETLLLGEAHRILGHPDQATECFNRTEFSFPVARKRLIKLVRCGDIRVIQIAPLGRSGNPRKMPEPRPNSHPRGQIVPIAGRRYLFNTRGGSGRGRWALIDPEEGAREAFVFFLSENSEIREVKHSEGALAAQFALQALGYQHWDGLPDFWEDYAPPGGPFFIVDG